MAPHSIQPNTLVLVPTELEARRLEDAGGIPRELGECAIVGFGPIAAAARTTELILERRPLRVLLVGIAGGFDLERTPVGSAVEFDRVCLDGVGVGALERFEPPPLLGFPQWPGERGRAAIFDSLELSTPRDESRTLLTTCAASADGREAGLRVARFGADLLAEDMEGFAVAFAASRAALPLRIVRGISNRVGDRKRESWRIPAALSAARELALRILTSEDPWERPA